MALIHHTWVRFLLLQPEFMSKKRSRIWQIPKEDLVKVVQDSNSLNAVLNHFGFWNQSGVYKTLKARLQADNIDISHIVLGIGSNKGRTLKSRATISLKDILIEHSVYDNRSRLKQRLFKNGLLENKCSKCGQLPEWNGEPLTLQLDHINGISDDNRLENLRILCPHCHSQTGNFAGRNKGHQN